MKASVIQREYFRDCVNNNNRFIRCELYSHKSPRIPADITHIFWKRLSRIRDSLRGCCPNVLTIQQITYLYNYITSRKTASIHKYNVKYYARRKNYLNHY